MIHNINILIHPDVTVDRPLHIRASLEEMLVEAHRRGEHPYGEMRRDCPLCQMGRG